MKLFALVFFGSVTLLFFGGVGWEVSTMIQSGKGSWVEILWTIGITSLLGLKLLEFTGRAAEEYRAQQPEWRRYENPEPRKRALYGWLAIASITLLPVMLFFGMIFDVSIGLWLFQLLPLPSVIFLYLALFGAPRIGRLWRAIRSCSTGP